MNPAQISIKNYRSIPINSPIKIEIPEGITFILGLNNVGKSNILKLFFEFRESFRAPIGEGAVRFPNNTRYGSIVNQRSGSNTINLDLHTNTRIHSFVFNPIASDSNLDQPEYQQHYQVRKVTGEPEPNEFDIYMELFTRSLYVSALRTVNSQSHGYHYDFTNGTTFVQEWDEWQRGGSPGKVNRLTTLKHELRQLFGFRHLDISTHKDKNTFLITTEDGTFALEELGAGFGHFLLTLGNALFKQPSFIMVDEPETGLHPKQQEIFVRALAAKAKYGLIATSHSIGLARSVGSDRIYSLTKDTKGNVTLSDFGNNYKPCIRDAIDELGYSQFVELGGINILLVEGTTDILSFREILRKYDIEQHFIIWALGGSSGISADRHDELLDLKRLNARSYNIIFDSEISHEGEPLKNKFQAFKEMAEKLGFNVFPTDYHSTDNYISQAALENVDKTGGFKALDKYESLKNHKHKWSKSLNWKFFQAMTKSDFEHTRLHQFIVETLVPVTNERKLNQGGR